MTGSEIMIVLLGGVVLGAALLVVTSRRMVHAALWFVVAFGALAGCFIVLTAEFVAWVQVLIYVGAVVVLLLFGIMLTRAPIAPSADADSRNRPAALLVAGGTGAVLVAVVPAAFPGARLPIGGPGAVVAGSAEAVGTALFAGWVWPFEVLSVLLLAALIGAIVLTRADVGPREVPGAPVSGREG
ncbi:NADH-quinone oxidoreductase subunit J [Pseudonocardia acidicola]|uniref:NADH-quinone oxidoreductase subunit J n=1 Tax=Pseudonocardia acidicola TaxID=2724939 RepID=A0ABX1S9B8_9PSEU|nr:NADH-quinone oxidoreductase subunit J [Pseudonocardia acidicola]NMH97472.1 NADH-quinone oxidoreductase subunit J [Pseudonocardia acidicola]